MSLSAATSQAIRPPSRAPHLASTVRLQRSLPWSAYPMVAVATAMSAGIIADRYGGIAFGCWLALGFAFGSLWLLAHRLQRDGLAAWLLLASLAATAGGWHHVRWRLFSDTDLGRYANETAQPICLEAIALDAPRLLSAPPPSAMATTSFEEKWLLTVRANRVRHGQQWQTASGEARLIVPVLKEQIGPGDRMALQALLAAPLKPLNPGEFDFAAHERSHRRLAQLAVDRPECVRVMERGSPWNPRRLLAGLRQRCEEKLREHLASPRAELARVLLIGSPAQLDADRKDRFFLSGMTHVLSISGVHVGILAFGLWKLGRLSLLPRRLHLAIVLALVAFYALLAEAQPPVVRAAMLVTIFCVGSLLGRDGLSLNSLAAAAVLLLATRPTDLFQTGVQLSFLGVASLMASHSALAPRTAPDALDELIARSRPWPVRLARSVAKGMGQALTVSAAVWLATLPLIAHQFHLVAFTAIPLNPITFPLIGVALYTGFGVLLFGFVAPPLADVCGAICDLSLAWLETTLAWGQAVPGGHVWTPGPPLAWMLAFYAGLALVPLVPKSWLRRRWKLALALLWLAVGYAACQREGLFGIRREPPTLATTFMAVGHGTSVLVELPDGRTLLYDAGSLGAPLYSARPICATLWSRRIHHLDAVVLSHADIDHYNALPELLKRFSVGVVYVSPVMFRGDAASVNELRLAIERAGVPIRHLSWNERLACGSEVTIEALHPPPQGVSGSDNANSIVLSIESQGRRLLLPGDLETPGLEDMLAEEPLDCDIAMAPHHGSARSNPLGFADWTTPEWLIVSGGRGRGIEAIHEAAAPHNARVLHTAVDGAVRVEIASNNMSVRAWRHEPWD